MSRWLTQQRRGGPYSPVSEQGDCLAACCASILGVPIEDVDFPLGEGWWERLHKKIGEYGYCIADVKMDTELPRGLWIATVPSLNLKAKEGDDKPILHCVVARGEIFVHDPSKSIRYDERTWADAWNAEKIVEGWAFAALDPAGLEPRSRA